MQCFLPLFTAVEAVCLLYTLKPFLMCYRVFYVFVLVRVSQLKNVQIIFSKEGVYEMHGICCRCVTV